MTNLRQVTSADFGYPVQALTSADFGYTVQALTSADFGYTVQALTSADFGYTVQALWFSCSQKCFNYLGFQSFDFERHLMKIIPEACRVH